MNGGAGYQKTGIWLILAWIFLPVETAYHCPAFKWWRCRDLNPGHYGYEPYALTG